MNTINHKTASITLALTLVFSVFATTQFMPAYADPLTGVSVIPTSNLPGHETSYAFVFIPATLKAIKKVELKVDSGTLTPLYDITGAKIVSLTGFRPAVTISKVDNGDGTLSIFLEQRPIMFRPGEENERRIEITGIVNAVTEGAHTWTITTYDRNDVAVDTASVIVTLKNVEIIGSSAGVEDASDTTDGSKADPSFDLTVDTLKVGGSLLLFGATDTIDTSGGTGVTIDDPLSVTGTTMLAAVSMSGLATLSGGIDMAGGTIMDSTGPVSIADDVTISSLLTVGSTTIDSTTGDVAVGGTLGVTGASTLSGGASVLSGLSVTGGTTTDFLTIDAVGAFPSPIGLIKSVPGNTAGASPFVVFDSDVTLTSNILITFVTGLPPGVTCQTSIIGAGIGFLVECSGAGTAGTETFNYVIID